MSDSPRYRHFSSMLEPYGLFVFEDVRGKDILYFNVYGEPRAKLDRTTVKELRDMLTEWLHEGEE
ncbi:hypothetical protein [Alicyclobacillus acidoterrestris]|uniref:Uncharacterized protein n=1 Tax=Alicyclobacillus acidoterrestris (strain ATCC 49025 / DSM 3922 / CIP 106132 / NCIMB 13137 / GD3B) TaxID=1356854 RepID=T0BSQ2_ALIAG|nr:hypothetical protein [Alicyclobacillus acidoterrestris]EPZ43839.1 hypothetical protein N007_12030 [Alicyclobacillus acidoterrestris ATCC 49025]UNO49029.1 hypothetical protein K1I37_00180 [Alicyclobacillus acidoterrestris]